MFINKYENLLESFFIQEGNDIIKYNKLSEEDKQMFSKEIVMSIVKSIEDKSNTLDNVMINKSKGDITKVDSYRYIKNSLDLLNNMQASYNGKIPYLDTLNDSHKHLIEFKDDFEKGYRINNEVIKLLYSQLVLSLIESVSFLISVSMDYVKDPVGNYEANLRYNLDKLNKYPTINIECLEKFNLMCVNGEMRHFFVLLFTDKSFKSESFFPYDVAKDVVSLTFAGFGSFGKILVGLFSFIPSIPELLRMLIYLNYKKRIDVADYLRLQSHFLDLNIERQRNLQNPNKRSIKKQEKIMRDLIRLADKIDIDQKTSDKQVRNEIEKENKNISKSIKSADSNKNQIKNSINQPEEIIL